MINFKKQINISFPSQGRGQGWGRWGRWGVVPLLLFLAACSRPEKLPVEKAVAKDTSAIHLRTTPVKYQGSGSYCWIYAMLACIETERLEQYDDSVELDVNYLIDAHRKEWNLRQRFLTKKEAYCQRGMGNDCLRLIEHYGLSFKDRKGGKDGGFYLYGMHYTPKQFAGSVYKKGDWQWFTSFGHHPYGEEFALEVPDNTRYYDYMNVTPDSLLALTVRSIQQHHPVYWQGSMRTLRDKRLRTFHECRRLAPMVASRRQALFTNHVLTDDHAMAIVGMAYTKKGHPYFILKNSWGKGWGKDGYGYMLFDEFLLRTTVVAFKSEK